MSRRILDDVDPEAERAQDQHHHVDAVVALVEVQHRLVATQTSRRQQNQIAAFLL